MDDVSKVKGCQEVYEKINKRQKHAVEFHCQMVSLFDFLNLKGFRAMHEYQFVSESMEHMKTKHEFMKHHQRLIKDGEHPSTEYIEREWYENERGQVPTQIREKSVKQAIEQYYHYEKETKTFYEECLKRMMELGCMHDFSQMQELLKDVSEECKNIERLKTELEGVGYDSNYIFQMQDKLYDKYRKKMAEIPEIKRMFESKGYHDYDSKEWHEKSEYGDNPKHHEMKSSWGSSY